GALKHVDEALSVDGARPGGKSRDDLRHVEGLDLDEPLLSEVHEVPGRSTDRAEKEHGDHRDAPPQTDVDVAGVVERRTGRRAASAKGLPARQERAKAGFA